MQSSAAAYIYIYIDCHRHAQPLIVVYVVCFRVFQGVSGEEGVKELLFALPRFARDEVGDYSMLVGLYLRTVCVQITFNPSLSTIDYF